MKNLTYLLFLFSLAFLSYPNGLFADDHDHHNHKEEKHESETHEHEEHEGEKFGPDKAILEVKKDGQQFKLSTAAEKTMGIKSQPPATTEQPYYYKVARSSLVEYQDKIGIYKEGHHWYELLEVTVVQTMDSEVVIYCKELKLSDKVAFLGVGLLRVAHLEASGQGGEGHAH